MLTFLKEKKPKPQTSDMYNSNGPTLCIFENGGGYLSGEGMVWFEDFDDLVFALQEVQEERLLEKG